MQISTISGTSGQPATAQTKAGLEKAAQQFEAVFIRQMIGAMRSASLAEGIDDSSATEQFRDMADARTADSMSTKGSLGIAELLMKQFGNRVVSTPQTPGSVTTPNGPTPAEGA